ncbi:MAG TPA: nickel-responsive transcriptional regulator NikR [Candidatus Dormibacteraeota bacterium]|jgi:CopG family nickel-responsive transcriptional regulator|nr:nickel-responsive transcriptional regulator NikR [Candidatus Dormibacteraeota bacterium]
MAQRKTAEHATRFTVSLPGALMQTLDRLRSGREYSNRSEFVRDLLRAELVKEEWQEQTGETVGVLVLVYDHDTRALADKLTDIQHEHHGAITAALHVHLDAHTCLEVIPLRGAARRIRQIANRLLSIKGVRYGQLVPATGRRLR